MRSDVFWDVAILYAVDMTQPTQPALFEQSEHAWKVGSEQNLGVRHSVLPGYAKGEADASEALCTTILVSTVSLGLVHTLEMRSASAVAASPILLSISESKERYQ